MSKRMILLLTTVLTLAAVAGGDAFAYTYSKHDYSGAPVKLSSGYINLRAHVDSFPAGSYREGLAWSVSEWNKTPAKMFYNMIWDYPSVGQNNGLSEVWIAKISVPAVTKIWYLNGLFGPVRIIEADVIFNYSEPYTSTQRRSDLWEYGGSFRSFQTTAMHELGHVQGLGHTADRYSIMGTDWTHVWGQGSKAFAYVGSDAVSGSISLYGADAGQEDLAVAHWRRTGASGEYSVHSRTRLLGTNLLELFKTPSVEPLYVVGNGQTVLVETTLEKMPASTVRTFYVGLMLSDDANISKSDKLIRLFQVTLDSGNPTPAVFAMTLPSGIPPGSFRYIGVILDYFDQVIEVSEPNNAAYMTAVKFF